MRELVLDTDVASLSLKDWLPPGAQARLSASLICITFVTVAELTQWMRLQNWGPRRRATMAAWLAATYVLEYDQDVATLWGELSAAAIARGNKRPTNDMWIAACCISERLPLATRNVKDFAYFADHHGLDLISV